MGKEDYRIYKELLDGRLLASSTELVVRHPSGRDDAHARALASWCLLPLLQREAVAAAARGGSPRLQLAEPLRLFLISSPQTHSAAACLAEVEQEAKALQQQLPELQVEVLGSKGAGGARAGGRLPPIASRVLAALLKRPRQQLPAGHHKTWHLFGCSQTTPGDALELPLPCRRRCIRGCLCPGVLQGGWQG